MENMIDILLNQFPVFEAIIFLLAFLFCLFISRRNKFSNLARKVLFTTFWVVLALYIGMKKVYYERAVRARLRSVGDQIGTRYEPFYHINDQADLSEKRVTSQSARYEPYYLEKSFNAQKGPAQANEALEEVYRNGQVAQDVYDRLNSE
jgi:hypothetical protein